MSIDVQEMKNHFCILNLTDKRVNDKDKIWRITLRKTHETVDLII